MFQLSRSSEPNPTNLDPNTALPNSYGHIRTMKEDIENLKAGRKEINEEALPEKPAVVPSAPLQEPSPNYRPPDRHPSTESGSVVKNKKDAKENDLPNPFGSEAFFETHSPFEEKQDTSKRELPEIAPKPKSPGKLIFILLALLILSLLGGGAYYWWFFIKIPSESSKQAIENQPISNNDQPSPVTEENSDLAKWSLDLESDKVANKLTIERNVKTLASSAPEGKAIEIKFVSSDGQAIAPQKLEEIFDFQLPASISENLTEDYSLFLTKENDEPRLGAAFRLSPAENLSESLKSEEGSIVSNIKSFYLDKVLGEPEISFSSSKHKSADIRYFNFPGIVNVSLDYTVLSDKQNTYFIFSTSKDSIRAILDYMSEK